MIYHVLLKWIQIAQCNDSLKLNHLCRDRLPVNLTFTMLFSLLNFSSKNKWRIRSLSLGNGGTTGITMGTQHCKGKRKSDSAYAVLRYRLKIPVLMSTINVVTSCEKHPVWLPIKRLEMVHLSWKTTFFGCHKKCREIVRLPGRNPLLLVATKKDSRGWSGFPWKTPSFSWFYPQLKMSGDGPPSHENLLVLVATNAAADGPAYPWKLDSFVRQHPERLKLHLPVWQ